MLSKLPFLSRRIPSPSTKTRRITYLDLEFTTDDTVLVSFPKSGNTWLRFILAHYLTNKDCDFDSVKRTIPGIHSCPELFMELDAPRFIKSHFPYSPQFNVTQYPRVVYLARDGRDVAVSYYHYQKRIGKLAADISFEEYLLIFNQATMDPYSNWSMHINYWLTLAQQELLVVTYEEMQRDTMEVMKKILQFSGLEVHCEKLATAIEKSQFKKLQKIEENSKSFDYNPGMQINPETKFIREGKINNWKKYFSDSQAKEFYNFHREAFERLDYAEV